MSDAFRRTLWWLIAVTRGGRTRARIILKLKERPMNASQLAQEMQADYKTTRQHLELMYNNRLLVKAGNRYSVTYFPSPELEAHWSVFSEIMSKIKEAEP